jgi:hypothetical protein
MPVRSSYSHTKPPSERRTAYPLKRPVEPSQEPPQSQQQSSNRFGEVKRKLEPTIKEIKATAKAFGQYIEKNQAAYQKAHPHDTTFGQDLARIPGRVVERSGEFGKEQRQYLRSKMRQDPNLIHDIAHPHPQKSPIKFEVSKEKERSSRKEERAPRQRKPRAPRAPRAPRQRSRRN